MLLKLSDECFLDPCEIVAVTKDTRNRYGGDEEYAIEVTLRNGEKHYGGALKKCWAMPDTTECAAHSVAKQVAFDSFVKNVIHAQKAAP